MSSEEMIKQQVEKKQTSGNLLRPDGRAAFERVASSGASPSCERAAGLLALDEGATQKEAAEQSGLSVGQLQYWLKKYRNEGMAIFPEAAVDGGPDVVQQTADQTEPVSAEPQVLLEENVALVDAQEPVNTSKKKKKVKKSKKTKSSKEKKVAKKSKKAKKTKKSKKSKKQKKSKKKKK